MPENKLNYSELGLKCGLEVHQQLDAENRKLFCNCPSVLRVDEPDYKIKRKLHVVAGESGEIDVAAAYQASLDENFIYQGYDTTCLVELDEEPPSGINKEALNIALQISLLLNAKIFSITQIMRKTVIDGSNTSGFQRTVLISWGGFVETSFGRVGIESICLEEDAARIVERKKNEIIYRLDRLGIPLIEISTSPDIKNPLQAKEVALKIGEILRSCNVKRGLGTIRQDVNVSIKNGKRVEIKGVQEPDLIIKAIDSEVERQQLLIEQGKKINSEVRRVLPDGKTEFLRPMPGAARMYPETDLPLLRIPLNLINDVKKNLPKLKEDIEKELRKKRLNNELIKLILEGYLDDFRVLLEVYPQDPQLVAKMLTIWRSELASKLKKDINQINSVINLDILETILEEVKKGNIDKNQIRPIFSELMKDILLKDIIVKKIEAPENIEEKIRNLLKSKPGLSEKAYMGLIMKEFCGKVSGKEVMEIVKKNLKGFTIN